MYFIFFYQSFNSLIAKMSVLITRIISTGNISFYLFWNIINNKQYINKPKRTRKRSHKIHTPHIRSFTIQHGCLQHLMSMGQTTYFLTLFATFTKFIGIFKHCFPIKSTMQNFPRCYFRSKMSTTCIAITISKNEMNFIVMNSSSNNLIWFYFPKIRYIPYVILRVIFFLFLLALCMSFENIPTIRKLTILANHGSSSCSFKSCPSGNVFEIGICFS